MSGLRSALHETLDAQQNKFIQSFTHNLCDMKFVVGESGYDNSIINNFLLRIHAESILHSCRVLLQMASDMATCNMVLQISSRRQKVEILRECILKEVSSFRASFGNFSVKNQTRARRLRNPEVSMETTSEGKRFWVHP